jgi:hypothetical protein
MLKRHYRFDLEHTLRFPHRKQFGVRPAYSDRTLSGTMVCSLVSMSQARLSPQLPVKVINALNIPVREVGMISQFARWSLIHALAEHHPEAITGQKAPTGGVDRVLLESKNIHVVTSRHLQITDRQHAAGIDDLSHALLSSA